MKMQGDSIISALIGLVGAVSNNGKTEQTDSVIREACFAADTHAVESLRVWEACFVADTHAVESLRV